MNRSRVNSSHPASPKIHTTSKTKQQLMNDTAVDILALLQAYHDRRVDTADPNLQSAVWNLTKARRAKLGFGALPLGPTDMTASTVRWDLQPRVVVRANTTPLLEEEGDTGVVDVFQMMDVSKQQGAAAANDEIPRLAEQHEVGLRQRKKKGTTKSEAEWIMEEETRSTEKSDDPLIIMGGSLPPKELHIAHAKAVAAVEEYIKAASLVAAIQQRLKNES